ncbi:hypothetical protein [Hydrocarboniphaga sp.]|uniref:hypothetical protein n=1 Tax=Hydrocarboniphaga sp. TaxID=2033016 RepID=UPI003D0E88E1
MTISYRSKLMVVSAGALLALALTGCHDNGHEPGDDMQPADVNALATTQINTKTCEKNTPDEINALDLNDTDEAIDVATLTPACSGSI